VSIAGWAGSINTDQAQQRSPRSGKRTGKHRPLKPVPEAALGAVRDTLREHGEPIAAGAMTFMQARTANEVLKAQERRLRLQQKKGELVDRAKAVAQVFRLARDERDAWVNWPARVAAKGATPADTAATSADAGVQAIDPRRRRGARRPSARRRQPNRASPRRPRSPRPAPAPSRPR
jgi:hypothetical protein